MHSPVHSPGRLIGTATNLSGHASPCTAIPGYRRSASAAAGLTAPPHPAHRSDFDPAAAPVTESDAAWAIEKATAAVPGVRALLQAGSWTSSASRATGP